MQTITRIMDRVESTNPAIARPLGALNSPMMENIRPSTQRMIFANGTQQKIQARSESTNPAVPRPLVLGRATTTCGC